MSYCCGLCTKKTPCNTEKQAGLPNNCPCRETDMVEWSKAQYVGEDKKIADAAVQTEYEGYCKRTRVEEIMEFATNLGIHHIGIAHCIGLKQEAGIAYKIFTANGFKVDTVSCKAGTFSKKELGHEQYQINKEWEGSCNPIGQAKFLENAGCELAVVMGLCVGHDTLFLKNCNLPVTYLVVKDRVLGHNPVQALYLSESYLRFKLYPPTRQTGNISDVATQPALIHPDLLPDVK
ncbi:DUF1847 domain-containing protein [Intestinibacillus massiliensis]|uniref:DUF1847 domain-containing protein n=1 Tax=Intestinibacillus massiliensis TaxID=1871029 RepID=UPI000B35D0EA|nr:DUF1847 domain-containing protein [Intestinibacillus massiliensis]MCB6365411.1 DUF1847 domain-containing protein [Intestinibacillus massiliensis]